jgi:hypothetical protein
MHRPRVNVRSTQPFWQGIVKSANTQAVKADNAQKLKDLVYVLHKKLDRKQVSLCAHTSGCANHLHRCSNLVSVFVLCFSWSADHAPPLPAPRRLSPGKHGSEGRESSSQIRHAA